MSEIINNREHRQSELKKVILELHDGKSVEEVKERFAHVIEGVSAAEISAMETSLVEDGMPIEEIQRLCDVHASVFKGSIEDIHKPTKMEETSGHPVHTFRLENTAIKSFIENNINDKVKVFAENDNDHTRKELSDAFTELREIDKHYSRKENLLFPYMEKYGITAPPKVMWGVDDEIRDGIKIVISLLEDGKKNEIIGQVEKTLEQTVEMIFKEENILFPMVIDTLTIDEWYEIAKGEDEIGYTMATPNDKWVPEGVNLTDSEDSNDTGNQDSGSGMVKDDHVEFDAGMLLPKEINAILNTIPLDITFVDKDGKVKYFTQGKERLFARPKTVLGREVSNCHPPASVHVVEDIVADLMSGKKDHEEFWIKMGDKYVHIRYFAVRDKDGSYLGTMEFSQDIAPLQAITGEKRLLDS